MGRPAKALIIAMNQDLISSFYLKNSILWKKLWINCVRFVKT